MTVKSAVAAAANLFQGSRLFSSPEEETKKLPIDESPAERHRTGLCVQTFNTYGPAYGRNLAQRTATLGSLLQTEGPCDVLQFQEVWKKSHYKDLTRRIQALFPGVNGVFFDDLRTSDGKRTGLTTFLLGEPHNPVVIDYPINADGLLDQARQVVGAVKSLGIVTTSLGRPAIPVLLINTHAHPTSQAVRITQMMHLADVIVSKMPLGEALLLAGDFNFVPDSVEYHLLRDFLSLKDAYAVVHGPHHEDMCTYCDENPYYWGGGRRLIDFVWYRSNAHYGLTPTSAVINLKKEGRDTPSDHYGIRVRFDVAATEGGGGQTGEQVFHRRTVVAVKALSEADEILKATGEARFELVRRQINGYKHRLEEPSTTDRLVDYFHSR